MGTLKRHAACTWASQVIAEGERGLLLIASALQSVAMESGHCCCCCSCADPATAEQHDVDTCCKVAVDMLGTENFVHSVVPLCLCVPVSKDTRSLCLCVCVCVCSCVCTVFDSVCRLSQLLRRVQPLVRWWSVCSWIKSTSMSHDASPAGSGDCSCGRR